MNPQIPTPVAIVVGDVLGGYYYKHRVINNLFVENGAPGEPTESNCVEKISSWLKRASADPKIDGLVLLGGVLEELMEVDRSSIACPRRLVRVRRA